MSLSTTAPSIRPIDAARALAALRRDPDDTSQVFAIIEALSGDNHVRLTRRMAAHPAGARLLRERRNLAQALADRAHLAALPEASLGRAYLSLCEQAGITPQGLVEASETVPEPELTDDTRFVRDLLRDQHDLWHVVTGYQTDTVGEAALLAFSFAQTRNRGVGLISLVAFIEASERAWVRPLIARAFVRGLRASWLPAVDWEARLARPLEAVRRELRVGTAPVYTPLWSEDYKRERQLRRAG
jgi:ubiquinone biosynthesis protein COQ4